ncbi:MAG: hypothetical protein QXP36_02500 [Conexivisphaerales archaeon]
MNNRQKTTILKQFGPVRNATGLSKYKNVPELEKESLQRLLLKELTLLLSLHFGTIYASRIMMERKGIMKVLRENMGPYLDLLPVIVSRLIEQSSDLGIMEFCSGTYSETYIYSEQSRIYMTLDKMITMKEEIEDGIFDVLKPDITAVNCNLASTYFKGKEDNDLALISYSRDKKRKKKQVMIVIVMADGIPIYHKVWPGNTVYSKTLESTLTTLKERFHIKNVTFIEDRAFGRNRFLKLLDRNRYITATYHWDRPYRDVLMETVFSNGTVMDDLIVKEVSINVEDVPDKDSTVKEMEIIKKRRHIAVINRERERLNLLNIEDKLVAVKERMDEIIKLGELKKSQGELKSFVIFTKDGVSINNKRIEMMKNLAGRFLIVTNTDMDKEEFVKAYKEQ